MMGKNSLIGIILGLLLCEGCETATKNSLWKSQREIQRDLRIMDIASDIEYFSGLSPGNPKILSKEDYDYFMKKKSLGRYYKPNINQEDWNYAYDLYLKEMAEKRPDPRVID